MEHVILVAVVVDHDGSREEAELWLHERLNEPAFRMQTHAVTGGPYVDSWWIAEDERHDRSDLDSAVFVVPGQQVEARNVLLGKGLAQ